MPYKPCPKCGLNYIAENEELCAVCSQARKSVVTQSRSQRGTRKDKTVLRTNIAFKCTYCDGGKSDVQVGFCGLCSRETANYNVYTKGRAWCSNEGTFCRKWLEGSLSREELETQYNTNPESVCYESNLFREWVYKAGIVLRGKNKGRPKTIKGVQTNSLCILTTIKPYSEQCIIFGAFIVKRADEGDDIAEGKVTADSKYRIVLTDEEASKMLFWNYHKNKDGGEKWASGLYRYIPDNEAVHILQDIVKVKQGTPDEAFAQEMLEYYCNANKV